MFVKLLVGLVCLMVLSVESKTAQEWQKRIIYQILTDRFSQPGDAPDQQCSDLRSYCGGTFKGIQKRLDYITGLGANAIWISPIVENTVGGYHGYWAKDIFKINPNFGTEDDLEELVKECHKRDVWVMVDVVANHMGYPGACNWTNTCTDAQLQDYKEFRPFNETEHYHPLCHIRDWQNQTEVELCRLANLPDLNSSHPFVRSTQMKWITDLQKKYDIDGFRVDTVHLIEKSYWREFQSSANVFLLGEVNYGDRQNYNDTGAYLDYMDSVFNFPLYWALRKVYNQNQTFQVLVNSMYKQRRAFKNMNILGTFADNHDHERFLHFTPDVVDFKNALAYVMVTEGIPVIYYGTEQGFSGAGDPKNRESLWPHYDTSSDLYKFLKVLSDYRLGSSFPMYGKQDELAVDKDYMIFGRADADGRKLVTVIRRSSRNGGQLMFSRGASKYRPVKDQVYRNIFDNSDILTIDNKFGSYMFNVKFHDGGLPLVYALMDKVQPGGASTLGTGFAALLLPILLGLLTMA